MAMESIQYTPEPTATGSGKAEIPVYLGGSRPHFHTSA